MVVAAVVLSLWVHRAQAGPPVDLNDSGLHLSTSRWVADRVGAGHNPFDGWYPYLGLGFPQTHQYQSLPHVLTGILGLAVGVEHAYHWSLYLLLAGWPLAVYGGGRLLGIGAWAAAAAAALAPWLVSEPGYGFEAGSYTWQGLGIWPQLWAAWLLPIAIGLAWRALQRTGSPLLAGVALAACALCHLLTGWLAFAIVAVLALVHRDARRLALVLAAAAAASAWFVVPLLLDGEGAEYAGYERGTFWYDSFGARQVGRWLLSGELLDAGRLPVITVLAGVGLAVCVLRARTSDASRAVVALTALSLVLFAGRPTLGPIADLLPFGEDLFFPRFIVGVQLGGLLLAGIGAHRLAQLLPPPAVVVAGLLVVAPAVLDGLDREDRGRGFMAVQRAADADERDGVLALLASVPAGSGRVFAGALLGWGATYRIGYVPMYAQLLDRDVDAIGYQLRVASLATAAEARFDETDRAQLRTFGVRWMLLPDDREPAVPATAVGERGRHRLWRIAGPVDPVPEDGRLVLDVDVARPTTVGVAASWHPRWRATVDGEPVPVARTNAGTMAVNVDRGQHEVELRYVPFPHTWVLVVLGALGLAGLATAPARARRPGRSRRRPRRPPSPAPPRSAPSPASS